MNESKNPITNDATTSIIILIRIIINESLLSLLLFDYLMVLFGLGIVDGVTVDGRG